NLVFHFQQRGSLTLSHSDQSTTARSGDIVIADDTRPYVVDLSGQNDCLILQIPEAMLGDRFLDGDWHGKMLCHSDPNVAILRRFVQGLWCERDMLDQVDEHFDEIVVSATRLACAKRP